MKQAWLLIAGCALAMGQNESKIDVGKVTHGIEQRYNNIKTLQVKFTEQLVDRGGRHLPLTGVLYLEKPRKMRWEYTSPAGEFYLSDGSFDYDYDPKANKVQRSKVKEADDMRGPLAFLLGKVDFDRDFGSYTTGGADGAITAIPKSDKLPYSEISFVAGPDFNVKKLSIKSQEGLTTTFVFDDETVNPPLKADLFKFVKPAGAVIDDITK
jgi:outer membrane lipoprotein carrier protein